MRKIAPFIFALGMFLWSCSVPPEKKFQDALSSKNIDELEKVLKSGEVEVNKRLPNGHYPILFAVLNNDFVSTKTLIEFGGNVNIYGDTIPLFHAIEHEDERVFNLLISEGANISETDSIGRSLLFRCNFSSITQELLDKGLDGNIQDVTGKTPLIFFIESQNQELSQFYAKIPKTNIYLKDSLAKSAFDYAQELGLNEVLETLNKRKAKDQIWPQKGSTVYVINYTPYNVTRAQGYVYKAVVLEISHKHYKLRALESGDAMYCKRTTSGQIYYDTKEFIFRTRAAAEKALRKKGMRVIRG